MIKKKFQKGFDPPKLPPPVYSRAEFTKEFINRFDGFAFDKRVWRDFFFDSITDGRQCSRVFRSRF